MRSRFDVITIPRNVTVNDFCLAFVINLVRLFKPKCYISIPIYVFVASVFGIFLQQSLTNGSGFYEATSKELWTEGRKIVIKHKDTEEYFDDFSGVSKGGWKIEAFM